MAAVVPARAGCVQKILEPFLPTPVLETLAMECLHWNYDRPQSMGRVRMFYGNFGVFVRALAYILANGRMGCGKQPKMLC